MSRLSGDVRQKSLSEEVRQKFNKFVIEDGVGASILAPERVDAES
jgi:hypothetical protein